MRIVVDSNVIISAALTRKGISSSVVKIVEDHHTMLVSESAIDELYQTILRAKFEKYFRPLDTRIEIIARYCNKAEWISPTHHIKICRDPKDDKYLELALSGKADCIIIGDRDLLILNPFENIPVITPTEFLERFK